MLCISVRPLSTLALDHWVGFGVREGSQCANQIGSEWDVLVAYRHLLSYTHEYSCKKIYSRLAISTSVKLFKSSMQI